MCRATVLPLLLPLLAAAAAAAAGSELSQTLQRLHKELQFETLLLLSHSAGSRQCAEGQQPLEAAAHSSLLRFDERAAFQLHDSYNNERLLALVCATGYAHWDAQLWQALADNLQSMRHTRLLLWLPAQPASASTLQQLAEQAERLQLLHLVVWQNQTFQRLRPYAAQRFEQLQPQQQPPAPFFQRIANFQGRVAPTLPDQLLPRSLLYEQPGQPQLAVSGFVARLILEFARLHNITLQWQQPLQLHQQLPLMLLRNLTLNNTLSLPISLCGYEVGTPEGAYSYPYEVAKWLVSVPCPQPIATAQVYLLVVSPRLLAALLLCYALFALLDCCLGCALLRRRFEWQALLFNERMISGLLGQTFRLRAQHSLSSRLTQALLFLLGLVVSTLYAAHLKTLLTKHPNEPAITNFRQLSRASLSIYFVEEERFYFDSFDGSWPVDVIRAQVIYLNTSQFYALRPQLSGSHAFSLDTHDWLIMRKAQELYARPSVCYEPGLTVADLLLLSVPLQSNSVYERPLNRLIHRVHMTGLVEFWKQQTLRQMTALGQISLKDPSARGQFYEFKVPDLLWVWLCLCCGLLLALLFFLAELSLHKIRNRQLHIKL